MARKVVFVDDLDGSEITEDGAGPVRFSLRDEFFEIDLSAKNLTKLEKALQPFIDHATSVDAPPSEPPARARGPQKRVTKVAGKGRDYLDAVRRWARENGHSVADRGRIAASIIDEYEAAHKS